MFSYSTVLLVNNVLCVDHFDPDAMNIPELIEQKELIAAFPDESNEAFEQLCASLVRDLHSFESDQNNQNHFENFSKDVFKKIDIAETNMTRDQAKVERKMLDVLGKYEDKKPEDIDPEDVIKDVRVLIAEIYSGFTQFVTQVFEAKKEYVEKINKNAFTTQETKDLAKNVISTTEKQFGYIKKLHQLHQKGFEKALKMYFKGGKKMSPTKVLIIVGLVLVGVVILAVIAYYAVKPKRSDETQSSTV